MDEGEGARAGLKRVRGVLHWVFVAGVCLSMAGSVYGGIRNPNHGPLRDFEIYFPLIGGVIVLGVVVGMTMYAHKHR